MTTITLVSRIVLWLVVVAWGLVAVGWAGLYGVIVPRIGEFRPQLEAHASRVLGVSVKVGEVSAESSGLLPTVTLRDVVLYDPAGREALRLPRVLAALSVRTLWRLGFEQLYIDSPALDIRRLASGKILVAGLDLGGDSTDNTAADWLFSQTEFVIRNGSLRWTDEQRTAPPLSLQGVDLVLRNTGRLHAMRLDATPPAAWGERFSLRGRFTNPLLSVHKSRWQDWRGQIYLDFPLIDVSQLRQHADLGLDIARGQGAVRGWVDVEDGRVAGAVADLALAQVDARFGPKLAPLALQSVLGRLGGLHDSGRFELRTEGLQFRTDDGLQWPGGNLALTYVEASTSTASRGEFKGDRLDLAALANIGQRLPLGTATHAALTAYAPQGLVERVEAQWQGELPTLKELKASGAISGLTLASAPASSRPGLRGASIVFDMTHKNGRAQIGMAQGALDFPGVFEEPEVAVDQLTADVQWRLDGERIEAQVKQLRFANADAQGEASGSWHTTDPADKRHTSRFPGHLDLQGALSRADGTRVHRYLPLGIPKETRDYVRESVLQGQASAVKFKVRGNLLDMPYSNPTQGEFRIAAQIRDAEYRYVPPSRTRPEDGSWPALTQLSGELVFDRNSMAVNKASARFTGAPQLVLQPIDARIADLGRTTVVVNASVKGPGNELVGVVNTSALAGLTSQALARATLSGTTDTRLRLTLPISDINRSQVQGSVTFAGNDLRMTPDTPQFSQLKGRLVFSEKGFQVQGAQARMLGGDVKFDGGTVVPGPARTPLPDAGLLFRGQGTFSAEGLRQATELGPLARLAQQASGSASYTASLGLRRGQPELLLNTSLQGLALNLPAPLAKTAESSLPLRYQNTLVADSLAPGQRLQDQIALQLGNVASVSYLRDLSAAQPRVLRGNITVGASPVPSPAAAATNAVVANVNLGPVDLDAWQRVLAAVDGGAVGDADDEPETPPTGRVVTEAGHSAYLPGVLAVNASSMALEGYTVNNVVMTGSRDGSAWRARIDAAELNGQIEFRPSAGRGPGRLQARLKRLSLAPSAAKGVERILDRPPERIPALDIVVEDLELRGKKLGRVEIDAVNRGPGQVAREGGIREWRLNKFNLTVPEARFSATGNWAALDATPVAPGGPRQPGQANERRRTAMDFRLEVADSGELLKRFGMPGLVRRGKGVLQGKVNWLGSPLALDYPSLGGDFNVNMESGQFLKADPGIAKLLGVLNLQALPRRLVLDFRDVFSEGFAFDFVRGDVRIQQGVATTNNLQMTGVNAAVLMEGQADIDKETQDLKVVVVPEINAGTAALVAAVINPAIGLGTFLAQAILRRPVIEAATQEFHIDGAWVDPRITRVPRKPPEAAAQ